MNPRSTSPDISVKKPYSRMQATLYAMALAATLFTGCKKDYLLLNDIPTSVSQSASSPVPPPNFSLINYQFETVTPRADALVQWNSGHMSIGNFIFDGTRILGNALALIDIAGAANHNVLLFSTDAIGSLIVPQSKYMPINFKLGLLPLRTPPSILVEGYYLTNVTPNTDYNIKAKTSALAKAPVRFIVEVPVDLQAKLQDGFLINRSEYISVLSFTPAILNDGISQAMLDNAVRTNDAIIISSASNPAIYNIMLHNLDHSLQVRFETIEPVHSK